MTARSHDGQTSSSCSVCAHTYTSVHMHTHACAHTLTSQTLRGYRLDHPPSLASAAADRAGNRIMRFAEKRSTSRRSRLSIFTILFHSVLPIYTRGKSVVSKAVLLKFPMSLPRSILTHNHPEHTQCDWSPWESGCCPCGLQMARPLLCPQE